jgi:hypothetical protein
MKSSGEQEMLNDIAVFVTPADPFMMPSSLGLLKDVVHISHEQITTNNVSLDNQKYIFSRKNEMY